MNAVIFDMDGVIFDSERAVYNEWKHLSEKYGFEGLDNIYNKCIGVNAQTCRRNFLDYYGEDFPYDEYSKEKSASYHSKYDGGNLPLKKGIRELLEFLCSKSCYTAVASSTRSEVVKKQIEDAGLDSFFDRIIGGDMVTKSKPDPEIFLEAVRGTDADMNMTFVVEDSYNGIRAAKNAGMKPLMVPDMLPPDEEMKSLAWRIFSSLDEVREMFETIL